MFYHTCFYMFYSTYFYIFYCTCFYMFYHTRFHTFHIAWFTCSSREMHDIWHFIWNTFWANNCLIRFSKKSDISCRWRLLQALAHIDRMLHVNHARTVYGSNMYIQIPSHFTQSFSKKMIKIPLENLCTWVTTLSTMKSVTNTFILWGEKTEPAKK